MLVMFCGRRKPCPVLADSPAPEGTPFNQTSTIEEGDEEISLLEGAVAQCLFLRYGLDMDYRDDTWAGNVAVSNAFRSAWGAHLLKRASLSLPKAPIPGNVGGTELGSQRE